MTLVLLGPQRFRPSVAETVRSLDVDGPIAMITAGWEERERDDAELDGLLDGQGTNLSLFGRWVEVMEGDAEFAAADQRRSQMLEELQAVYLLRLHHAIQSVYELQRRVGERGVVADALADALDTVRSVDARHLERVAEVQLEFHDTWRPQDRPLIARHRDEVARAVAGAGAVVMTGGHVGALLACLQLFDVGPALRARPVVAWSAGAMAISETVVLFHDLAARGRGHAEVYASGFGLCHGAVLLPHARRRLRVEDQRRMSVLARRFAPARCLVLDDGVRVDCPDGMPDVAAATVVDAEGHLVGGTR